MEVVDFNGLFDELESKEQKCILVLGPEFINIDTKGVDFTESIHDYLIQKKFSDSVKDHYLSDDGLLFYDEYTEVGKSRQMLKKIGEFYKGLEVTESYNKLARIPFSAIVSLSPDNLMTKAYDQINKKYVFCRYSRAGFDEAPNESTMEKPMIYNLLGTHEDSHKLLFTFNNLFAFLDNIFQNSGKDNLRKHIKQATSFLFLGFNYDKWYLKLIFYLLKKFRDFNPEYESHAIFNYKDNQKDNSKISEPPKIKYYKASFKLKFSREDEQEFINQLFNACQQGGILSDINTIKDVDNNQLEVDKKKKYTILFFSSSPDGKIVFRSGETYQKMKEALNVDFYSLPDPVFQFKRNDITSKINSLHPNLLYFMCHGNKAGELFLSDADNHPDPFSMDELKKIIEHVMTLHKQINCIVFAACQSHIQAKEISKIVPYCIGMNDTVHEEVSDYFTQGFFEGFIRDKQNFEYAFTNGVSAIENCDKKDFRQFHTIPILYKNGVEWVKK